MPLVFTSLALFASIAASKGVESTVAEPVSEQRTNAPATQEVAPETGLVWVTSPWGFTDLYPVCHGWNCLICSGTGLQFRFFHRGF